MLLTLRQIWASQQALPRLLSRELGDLKASYIIGKNARAIDREYEALNEKRIVLVKRYGQEDEKTGQWTVDKAHTERFNKEFNDLLNLEVEVPIMVLNISRLADAKLTPLDIVAIDFMLDDK